MPPLAALVASGLQTDSFIFAGFLPTKTVARQNTLKEYADHASTLIFFESPNRLQECLADMISIFGEKREAAICRELTKLHEEISNASLAELSQLYENRKIKGEIVIIVGAKSSEDKIDIDALLTELMETMSVSRAASEAANLSGRAKRDLYQRALKLSGK